MKIISGGQTGVDRAALDVAIERGMTWGGWCPKGGWAEDFPDPPGLLAKYPKLRETPLSHPLQRTEWNVRDSDATLIITDGEDMSVSIGTRRAHQWAQPTWEAAARRRANGRKRLCAPAVAAGPEGEIWPAHDARHRRPARERVTRHLHAGQGADCRAAGSGDVRRSQ